MITKKGMFTTLSQKCPNVILRPSKGDCRQSRLREPQTDLHYIYSL